MPNVATISGNTIADSGIDLELALSGKANSAHGHVIGDVTGLQTALDNKQATLQSASNIKTINGNSLLGSGDLSISGGGGVGVNDVIAYSLIFG